MELGTAVVRRRASPAPVTAVFSNIVRIFSTTATGQISAGPFTVEGLAGWEGDRAVVLNSPRPRSIPKLPAVVNCPHLVLLVF